MHIRIHKSFPNLCVLPEKREIKILIHDIVLIRICDREFIFYYVLVTNNIVKPMEFGSWNEL